MNDHAKKAADEMQLRDYFAGKAIGLFPLSDENLKSLENGATPNHALVASFCYGLADAMFRERNKKKGQKK